MPKKTSTTIQRSKKLAQPIYAPANMAPMRTTVLERPNPIAKKVAPPAEDDSAPEWSEEEDHEDLEKSDTEQELERLVFGDSVGFREGLKNFQQDYDQDVDVSLDAEVEGEGLDNIADADVSCCCLSDRQREGKGYC